MKNSKLYRCVIVDDDRMSIDILTGYISKVPKLKILKSYESALTAIHEIDVDDHIDFLFLDIRMDISGIDVAKILRNKVKFIIFVTAYDEFALNAFSVGGDQYLVKPVFFPKFLETINQVLRRNNAGVIS
ncbi:response regulator [Pedobacter aquatilis]|uniref:LytR/AlgR family response regulator transcription factor n=1 Tax=Pedobacter aquatilis TaxID=351343 RepID=UPI0025B618B7|nr:response regulator [Pedobacter aquatilis]MDN3588839.1 response regulator [Pedobacter aquatilis]